MRITDTSILIQKRPFGEGKVLLSFFTPTHGRINGIARHSRKNAIDLGYVCLITWSARLPEQLGFITFEGLRASPLMMNYDYPRLLALQSAMQLLGKHLVERHPYPHLYDALVTLLEGLSTPSWHYFYVQFEMTFLEQLGFGLSLDRCVATGETENLRYISPKSGSAVSFQAGEPYENKLFPLPELFHTPLATDRREALTVLGYFLKRHLFEGRLPVARDMLIDHF